MNFRFWNWFSAKPKAVSRRDYSGAAVGRLFNRWTTVSDSADTEIHQALSILRARSRELERNNDYAKKFFTMLRSNVIGPKGIALQARARLDGSEEFDRNANTKIEDAWKEWGKKGVCTVDGKLSWQDVQQLYITAVARDGEFLARKVRGWDRSPFRFALQVLEADLLDEELNDAERNIRMGVQLDSWGAPVAYYLLKDHPGDRLFAYKSYQKKEYEVVPASEIIHSYPILRAGQTRGIPWMDAAMTRLRHIGEYEEAEVVAARIGACSMGALEKAVDNPVDFIGDGKQGENITWEMEPGVWKQLPAGMTLNQFKPEHPNGNFPDFLKAALRGVSSGLNVSYNSLGSNLEGVNFSSLRDGKNEERDNYRMIQQWTIRELHEAVHPEWLNLAIITQALRLPASKFDKWRQAEWKPRGWSWVDPEAEVKAAQIAIQLGLNSRTNIASEQGRELEEIFDELAKEEALADEKGVKITPEAPGQQPQGDSQGEEDEGEEEGA